MSVKITNKTVKEGHCFKCKSDKLDYQSAEIQDTMVSYPYICETCNTSGIEWYKLIFVETTKT